MFGKLSPIGLLETGVSLAATIATGYTEIESLEAGGSVQIPNARLNVNGIHYTVQMLVTRDAGVATFNALNAPVLSVAPPENLPVPVPPPAPVKSPSPTFSPEQIAFLQANVQGFTPPA